MYLLDFTDLLPALLTVVLPALIGIVILYYVIKAAVVAGSKEMIYQLRLNNNLKIKGLKANGVTKEEVESIMMQTRDTKYINF